MGEFVCLGALMMCTFGSAESTLTPTSQTEELGGGSPLATIFDFAPIENISPFGLCSSLGNPEVAAATAAALGVLTPVPCVPNTESPWTPGSSSVTLGGSPALLDDDRCLCVWGGEISITFPGQEAISGAG